MGQVRSREVEELLQTLDLSPEAAHQPVHLLLIDQTQRCHQENVTQACRCASPTKSDHSYREPQLEHPMLNNAEASSEYAEIYWKL